MKETTTLKKSIRDTVKTETLVSDNQDSLKVEWRKDGRLWVSRKGDEWTVRVTRCFPWSKPDRYVSLRDNEENEVVLVVSLTDLKEESRQAVEKALAEAGFVLDIVKVLDITEDFEIRSWEVITRQGPRKFQTALDDWPHVVPGGGLVIRDISGDLFFIDDPDTLDESSRKMLWAFIG